LYGYETWSHTVRKEHRLRVFENGLLRKLFGTEREKVAGGCRRLHNEEFYSLYALVNIVRVITDQGGGYVHACMHERNFGW
jgi:hypothetical protein